MATPEESRSKQSKGGLARAAKSTKQELSEIGRRGADARHLPLAVHNGSLSLGGITFECAVLEDETRVISESNFMESMGMYRSGALSTRREEDEESGSARIPLYLAYKNLKPFVDRHLGAVHTEPLKYRTKAGNVGHGIRAEVLPKICEVWLDARKEGDLGPRQLQIADKAEILIRGLAHVGIVALIDEATGFQYARQRDALEQLLEEFLSEELRKWVRTFPSAYFKELCRLRGVNFRPDMRLPQYFGHLTNDIVYKRLHPHVLKELQNRTGRNEAGNRTNKLFQHLSEDVGNSKLLQHLGLVIGLMRISKTYEEFKKHLDVASPVPDDAPLFNKQDTDLLE